MIKSKDQMDQGPSLLAGEERRRSQRVIIRVPLTLEMTKSGQVVKMNAHTVAVNAFGAMVVCTRSLDSGTKIEIVNGRTDARASSRVTRTPRESAEGYLIPLEFDKPFPQFWQISFPSSNWKPADVQ
jgi:hypothetical protein